MKRLFLHISDVAKLRDVKPKTAGQEIKKINKNFGVSETKFVSAKAFSEFYYMDEKSINEFLDR